LDRYDKRIKSREKDLETLKEQAQNKKRMREEIEGPDEEVKTGHDPNKRVKMKE